MYFPEVMERVIRRSEFLLSHSLEIPICSAIAIGPHVIAFSENEVQLQGNPLAHAEFLAVQLALREQNLKYLNKASIYVNLEPCFFCSSVLKKVRIKEIFFGAYSPKTGAIVHGERLFDKDPSPPLIVGGFQERRCSNIISFFFKQQIRG